ncbi:hypothetical protein [Xanthobacter autotrophicus]|uniref:hypothetical protein n=1 Tax=Xanthobacter autotrophicus TaxID=280 RepID=UPI00372CCA8C
MNALKVRSICLAAAAKMAVDPGATLRYASVFELFIVCGYLAAHEALDVLSSVQHGSAAPTTATPDMTAAPTTEDDPPATDEAVAPLLMH